MDKKIDADGTFSHDRREGSGPLELAYLNLVKLKQGTVVNERYRLEKLIGQGGFGIVFAALDVTLNSRVAVKFLNPRLTGNEKKFLRVQREINLSRKISDERIIKVFSLEKWQEIYFLVMELVAGNSLGSFLEDKGRCPWPEFKGIFLQILEAVDVLHRNGIVHRDLKPANILIAGDGKIKVLDFGLAKELADMDKTSTVGEIVGSPYYMSPEQIRGEAVDFRSDVYQLGLILYRALSGRHPFEHPSTMEVIFKQLNQQPEPLGTRGRRHPAFPAFRAGKSAGKIARPGASATPAPWPASSSGESLPVGGLAAAARREARQMGPGGSGRGRRCCFRLPRHVRFPRRPLAAQRRRPPGGPQPLRRPLVGKGFLPIDRVSCVPDAKHCPAPAAGGFRVRKFPPAPGRPESRHGFPDPAAGSRLSARAFHRQFRPGRPAGHTRRSGRSLAPRALPPGI